MKVLSNGALVVVSGRVIPTGRYECAVGFRHGDSGVVIARYDIQEGAGNFLSCIPALRMSWKNRLSDVPY